MIKWYSSKNQNKQRINLKLVPLFDNLGKIVIFLGGAYFIMISWGVNPVGWLASAGVLGIVLGLAAKDTLSNLFAGIFITIIPAIAILKAGGDGALSLIISSVSNEAGPINYMYFWATGILSSFLDNAPTYLVFFNTAGGDPSVLMSDLSQTLLAISAGAVFMGANTYIGNAPNFMVKSISESSGIEMPSFFGYFFKWSVPILIPLFVLVSLIFF